MAIDPKLYGKLCPKCRETADAFDGGADKDEVEVPEVEEGQPKPLEEGRKKAMDRVNGLAIIITPAEKVSRTEAAKSIDGGAKDK